LWPFLLSFRVKNKFKKSILWYIDVVKMEFLVKATMQWKIKSTPYYG
jgi:hypothetical protein